MDLFFKALAIVVVFAFVYASGGHERARERCEKYCGEARARSWSVAHCECVEVACDE